MEKLVPDTSVLIEGILGNRKPAVILVHEAALAYFESMAADNRSQGAFALEELSRLSRRHRLEFMGKRPSQHDISRLCALDADAAQRGLAHDEDAVFVTANSLQAQIAEAKGIKVLLENPPKKGMLAFEKFFSSGTMSVHLRENVPAHAKAGQPGNWNFEEIGKDALSRVKMQDMAREIIEEAKIRTDGFIEIERPGSTIVQLGNYRIVITRPPFSDGWEITAVRPVKQMRLEDYQLTEKLQARIVQQAEGILIAGSPGMGKSTFAAALAEFYAAQQKIVKTVEAPRDLVLPEAITQYAISHGGAQEIHDILLLSRPDYSFFDEMRNTDDFRLFADLRLAGIGFIGVLHATNPVDAIQRFVGRIELGVIPQVIDTVIYIKDGSVAKVLSLQMVVKVPSGMTEADLARPVVVVSDFETKKLEYEMYSYGEETVVIPVRGEEKSPLVALAQRQLEREFSKWSAEVEMVSGSRCIVYLPEENIAKIIGKQGKNISEIEKKLGIGIDVRPLESAGQAVKYDASILSKSIVLQLSMKYANTELNISVGNDYLLTAKASKKGVIKVKKGNKIGRILEDAINTGDEVRIIEA